MSFIARTRTAITNAELLDKASKRRGYPGVAIYQYGSRIGARVDVGGGRSVQVNLATGECTWDTDHLSTRVGTELVTGLSHAYDIELSLQNLQEAGGVVLGEETLEDGTVVMRFQRTVEVAA